MGRKVTLNLDADTEKKLAALAAQLGYSREMTAIYAVRLVSACVREGLLDGAFSQAWPGEAQPLAGGARVLRLPRKKSAARGDSCV